MIIDATYFDKGNLYIPSHTGISVNDDAQAPKIDHFIEVYERELLLNALGVTLYNELVTAMDDLPSAAQKWQELVDGTDYTVDSKTYRFDGLRGYAKQSLIAAYVYCRYREEDQTTLTTTGEVVVKSKNAVHAPQSDKYIKAWNMFLEQYQGIYGGFPNVIYNDYGIGIDWYGTGETKRSLYQYLQDNSDDFPDAPMKRYGIKASIL